MGAVVARMSLQLGVQFTMRAFECPIAALGEWPQLAESVSLSVFLSADVRPAGLAAGGDG